MMPILMVIHVFVTISLIGVVLIQRSEGGGLGIGSSQGMGAFMSGRGTANLLTRTTAVLAAVFLGLSLTMAVTEPRHVRRRQLDPGDAPDGSWSGRSRSHGSRQRPAACKAGAARRAGATSRTRGSALAGARSEFARGLPVPRFGFLY